MSNFRPANPEPPNVCSSNNERAEYAVELTEILVPNVATSVAAKLMSEPHDLTENQ